MENRSEQYKLAYMAKHHFKQMAGIFTHVVAKPARLYRTIICLAWAIGFSQHALAGGNVDEGIKDPKRAVFFTGTVDVTTGTHQSRAIEVDPTKSAILPGTALTSFSGETSRKVTTLISFNIKEETTKLIPTDFTASIVISIDYGPSSSSITTVSKTLTVDYKRNAGTKYNARAYCTVPDAEYVKVSITDRSGIPVITAGSNTLDTREVLYLVAEMDVTRKMELATGITPSTFKVTTNASDIASPKTVMEDAALVEWTWPVNQGINMLQLEWAWVEDEMVDNYKDGTGTFSTDLVFRGSTTRIDLPFSATGSYKIPFLYDGTGMLYVRMRPCNAKASGNRTDGAWASTFPKDGSGNAVHSTGHEPGLNWQVSTSFAEEGKSKTVISYFDGSLRSRQTVTKDNVRDSVLASETFYDYQGRPAVQVLPTPTMENTIRYQTNLNLFNGQANNEKDPAEFFDLQPINTLTSYATAYLKKTTGSSKYYSENNASVTNADETRFIPNANGYPFTVTRYTPDATGRVLAQSGVGEKHAMGGSQVTKYYYGAAAQVELDGLFGVEAGNASHYSKNLVKDANGQMSVSYVDMHGRTVATALAGDPDHSAVNLAPLSAATYPSGTAFTNGIVRDLLSDNTNRVKNNNAIESVNSLLISVPNLQYKFTYQLNPETLKYSFLNCNGVSFCHDCMYNLEITITNDAGEQSFLHGDPADMASPPSDKVTYKYNNINLDADQSCSTAVASFGGFATNKVEFSIYPTEAGSYSVRKTLTISEASLAKYKALFQKDQDENCFNTLLSTITTQLQNASHCNDVPPPADTLTCATCAAHLGDWETFRNNYLLSLGYGSGTPKTITMADLAAVPAAVITEIQSNYNTETEKCNKLCPSADHSVSSIRQMMLADMKPFEGQYAKGKDWTGNHASTGTAGTNPDYYAMHHQYDIFSRAFSNALYPHYLRPVDPALAAAPVAGSSPTPIDYYYNGQNAIDLTINASGDWSILNGLTNATDVANETEFANRFQNSWENALLPYHPEYNKLKFVETTDMKDTYNWLATFQSQTTWPSSGTLATVPGPLVTGTPVPADAASAVDKLYSYAYAHPEAGTVTDHYADMYTKVNIGGYLPVSTTATVTMWQVAYGNLKCDGATDRPGCYLSAPKNPAALLASPSSYPLFNSLTTDEMNKVWSVFQALYLAERSKHLNAYINAKVPFADGVTTSDMLRDHGYYVHFPKDDNQIVQQGDGNGTTDNTWWPTTAGSAPTGVSLDPADHTASSYQTKCESYAPVWKAELLQCPAIASLNITDQDQLLNNIIYGIEPVTSPTHKQGMIEVCVRGSDADNPDGASNAASPITGQPLNFKEVIDAAFAAHSPSIAKTELCNTYMIEWPKIRGKNPVITAPIITSSTSCLRSRFAAVKTESLAAEYADSYTGFNGFLSHVYKEYITESLYTHFNTFTTGSSELLKAPETVPVSMGCNYPAVVNCLTCADLSSHIGAFISEFGTLLGAPYNAAPVLTGTNQLTALEMSRNELLAKYINYRTGLQYTWVDYFTNAQTNGCVLTDYASNTGATQTVICRNTAPLNQNPSFLPTDPCQHTNQMAYAIAQNIYHQQMESKLEEWEKAYRAKCLSAQQLESFSVQYVNAEYHYTLYYYDQAGNLVKTVPPQGVSPKFGDATFLADVKAARTSYIAGGTYTDMTATIPTRSLVPDHSLITQYRYNTLNQVVEQKTPDAGTSHFWYDRLGRLVLSQNAKQLVGNLYSYTLYDDLGRIAEVGELPKTTTYSVSDVRTIARDQSLLDPWRKGTASYAGTSGQPHQVTVTQYDISYISGGNDLLPFLDQQNLRNRVSYTAVYDQITAVGTATPGGHSAATFYTYDIHGNVGELLQDYGSSTNTATANSMNAVERYKKIAYVYDLISGKVNSVSYQPGRKDQFYHRYSYDAENRLTEVETSLDNIYWERDATYQYYKHGPLARTVLGKQRVQGIDYAYTLQGWLKGVNSTAISSTNSDACLAGSGVTVLQVDHRSDYGQPAAYNATQEIDLNAGFSTVDGDDMTAEINSTLVNCQPAAGAYYSGDMSDDGSSSSTVARDAFGFSLNYFRGDYAPISTAATNPFAALPTGNLQGLGDGVQTGSDLFNGNIGSMLVNVPKLGEAKLYGYQYDKLNRLVAMNSYTGFNPASNSPGLTVSQEYKERISYDANGNILTYLRNGNAARLAMDDLAYTYKPNTNQLDKVVDNAADASTSEYDKYKDLKGGQANGNYQYDPIGNLISDVSEHITNIEWTVYGKIASVTKVDNGNTTVISYTYDASGNRISKTVSPVPSSDGPTTTWYVRDASGNVMAVYQQTGRRHAHLMQTEAHLYGSSRLGVVYTNRDMQAIVDIGEIGEPTAMVTFERGNKFFELSNHLGNVLATVTDRKVQIAQNITSTIVGYWLPDVATANDYYPFGMAMPGRRFNNDGYRYGFNGKENDKDVSEGVQDYGLRIYDARIGKFLSVDPLTKDYPELTPYQFASNTPIQATDLDGGEAQYYNVRTNKTETGPLWSHNYKASAGWVDQSPPLIKDFDVRVVSAGKVMIVAKEKVKAAIKPNAAHSEFQSGTPKAALLANTAEPEILAADIYGRGWMGKQSWVQDQIKRVKWEHIDAVGANIAGGPFGAADYMLNPAGGGFKGAAMDGIAMSFGGIEHSGNSSVLSRPGNIIQTTYLPYTERSSNVILEPSISKVMGNTYQPIGEVTTPIKLGGLLNVLTFKSKGDWVKVYEAGLLDGNKIETHYFRNNNTNQVFDVKTKYQSWHQKAFKNLVVQ